MRFGAKNDRKPAEPVGDPGQIRLEARVEALESAVRLLKVEWETVIDRVNRQIRNLGKQARRLEAVEEHERNGNPPEEPLSTEQQKGRLLHQLRGTHGISSR